MRGRARLQVHACLAEGWRKDLAFPTGRPGLWLPIGESEGIPSLPLQLNEHLVKAH